MSLLLICMAIAVVCGILLKIARGIIRFVSLTVFVFTLVLVGGLFSVKVNPSFLPISVQGTNVNIKSEGVRATLAEASISDIDVADHDGHVEIMCVADGKIFKLSANKILYELAIQQMLVRAFGDRFHSSVSSI